MAPSDLTAVKPEGGDGRNKSRCCDFPSFEGPGDRWPPVSAASFICPPWR